MRMLTDIRRELDSAIEARAELWEDLSQGHDAAKVAEASRLSRRIDELWAEARSAKAHIRFGSAELILQRARAEDRLERESRRVRKAA
jgi:hypothetical protein